MYKILVPTDFSKCANNAMTYAMEIAERTGASVTALYVVYPNADLDNSTYNAFFVDDYMAERLESMEQWVKKFTKVPRFQGVKVHAECKMGYPLSTIDETAQSIKASLIVMGTTGATGLRGVMLGSTASGVVAKSSKPVLVVPPKATFRNYARFALATDFQMAAEKNDLLVMRELLDLQHTGLDIVHVLTRSDAEPDAHQEAKFSKKLDTIPHEYHYLHSQDISQAIRNFVEARECNGLIAIAHEHSFLQRLFTTSFSRALAQTVQVPLLILHG
jgi:nucleotide-binding universal stress UspA family protein